MKGYFLKLGNLWKDYSNKRFGQFPVSLSSEAFFLGCFLLKTISKDFSGEYF